MMHYIIDSLNGNSNARIFWNVKLLPSPNAKSVRRSLCGLVTFGMDQYISWGLSKDDMNLDTIWERFEGFCKPQSNRVHGQFDLLTSFHQGNKSVNEWDNAVQAHVNLAKYLPETVKFYITTYFGSSYVMKILCQEPLQKEVLT